MFLNLAYKGIANLGGEEGANNAIEWFLEWGVSLRLGYTVYRDKGGAEQIMPSEICASYLDKLLADQGHFGLVWIASVIDREDVVDRSQPDYGLPRPLFLLSESLTWFASSIRSGVLTYFEVTPLTRQQTMHAALVAAAPAGFADAYAQGMAKWRDGAAMTALDDWMEENDARNNSWLWELVRENRPLVDAVMP